MKEQTILIVDDQKGIRIMLCEALKDEMFNVCSASNGIEAIAAMQKVGPDLILLDLKMPGMSGFDVHKELTILNPHVPIILMTAYADTNVINKLKQQGIKYLLPKPFDLGDLKKMISEILGPKEEKVHA